MSRSFLHDARRDLQLMRDLISYNISNFNLIAKLIIQGQGGVEDFEIMSEHRRRGTLNSRVKLKFVFRLS